MYPVLTVDSGTRPLVSDTVANTPWARVSSGPMSSSRTDLQRREVQISKVQPAVTFDRGAIHGASRGA